MRLFSPRDILRHGIDVSEVGSQMGYPSSSVIISFVEITPDDIQRNIILEDGCGIIFEVAGNDAHTPGVL